jgi:hypothetical protein
MKLFRTVSDEEFDDFNLDKKFRLKEGHYECKLFFKTYAAASQFKKLYNQLMSLPFYNEIIEVEIDEQAFGVARLIEEEFDTHKGIAVYKQDLKDFNKMINFVSNE